MRVAVDNLDDASFERELQSRDVAHVDRDADVALLGVETRDQLDGIAQSWSRVAPRGALWIVYPKGVRTVTEHDVRGAGLAAGLVDVKVVRFSDTHTGFRFVMPRARR
jgi:hypothetical protein